MASFAPYCTKELSSSNNSSSFGRASSAPNAPKIQQAAPLTLHLGLSKATRTGSIASSPIVVKAVDASLLTSLFLSSNVFTSAGIALVSPIAFKTSIVL